MMKQKGVASYYLIFLAVIIIAAGVLVGGMSKLSLNNSPVNTSNLYLTPVDEPPTGSQNNLQLRTIKFITIVPKASAKCDLNINGTAENDILWATDPNPGDPVGSGHQLKVFYSDEWPITLGSGNVSPLTKKPDSIKPPAVINTGTPTDKDANGFPYFPAIFISDITSDLNNKLGDAPGGRAYSPSEIYGTWKAKGPVTFPAPLANGLDLGSGHVFPTSNNLIEGVTYPPREKKASAEIVWNLDQLGFSFISGNTYRVEIIIHDGDHDPDIGMACITIKY